MHLTVEALREGGGIGAFWQAGFTKWRDLLRDIDGRKVTELAEAIGTAQLDYFERQCGGRALGQEIMAWSGIAFFYDAEEESFGDDLEKARKVYDALQLSHVSIAVKVQAERAAITYDLFEGLDGDGGDADA